MTVWLIAFSLHVYHHIRESIDRKKSKYRCQTCHKPLVNKYAITCDEVCHAKYMECIIRFDLSIDIEPNGYLFIKDKEEIK